MKLDKDNQIRVIATESSIVPGRAPGASPSRSTTRSSQPTSVSIDFDVINSEPITYLSLVDIIEQQRVLDEFYLLVITMIFPSL